ncbi:hypothetical protein ILUMI_23185 [Ignelater luminosus]|uniref:Uncharacterized protein n=1 Tax=Ignelater luminosus TaxID=2038154 RepID=A0A8K0FZT9_IGNLU|nr:hypothetical protein ILUMI_23185 [Ignelater luminosus]
MCLGRNTQNPLPSTSTRSTDEEVYLRDTDLARSTTATDTFTDSDRFWNPRAFTELNTNGNQEMNNIQKSQKDLQLTDSLNKDIPRHRLSTSTSTKDTKTTDDEALLQTLDLNQQALEPSEPEYFIPQRMSGFSKRSIKSLNQARLKRALYETSSSEEETISNASRRPRSKKKKDDLSVVEIKPKVSFVSDSDSNHLPNMRQAAINSDQGLISGSSHIVLKSAEAVQDMQDVMKNATQEPINKVTTVTEDSPEKVMNRVAHVSDLSLSNKSEVVDSEYEGDHEGVQIKIPNPKHRFKSVQELNTPEEIAKIEENVKENDQLEKMTKIILIASSSQFEYDPSSSSSNNLSQSNYSVKLPSAASGEVKVVDIETPLSSSLHHP